MQAKAEIYKKKQIYLLMLKKCSTFAAQMWVFKHIDVLQHIYDQFFI